MRLLPVLALLFTATPALAEPLEPTPGYFIGCDAEGSPIFCYANAAGINWAISQEDTDAGLFDRLQALPFLEPIILTGEFGELGDSSAVLTLTGLEQPVEEDIYIGNLRAMQGLWQPKGEEAAFAIEIVGMDWLERLNGEIDGSFMMSAGLACANGVEPGGMAINLYRYGDDPEADACWQLEYIDDRTMPLRDFSGEQGQVEFIRLPPSE
jgi:hypothetical protein